ncbi:MAG TPA: hypothetical protein VMS93_03290, partial [Candidatus Saccharimonadales bacterium]|nr:hypothetical protein [Candidatus Saccharimonadales bacterium]
PAVSGPPSPGAPAGPAPVAGGTSGGAAAAPGAPAAPAGVDPDDFAARVALDRSEQSAAAPAAATPVPAAGPERRNPSDRSPAAAPAPAELGAVLGLGVSAALIAFSLVLAFSQRRHFRALLRPGRSAPAVAPPAAAPAPAPRPARARSLRPAAADAAGAAGAAEIVELRRLAAELQHTIEELRAERARWEREWEQRETQWLRAARRAEQAEAAPADAPAAAPARGPEPEDRILAVLRAEEPRPTDPAGVLARVEQLLSEGLPAEEISRRLRVGLREIQWMMRLGALEAGSRG